jgi:hypothetical protein
MFNELLWSAISETANRPEPPRLRDSAATVRADSSEANRKKLADATAAYSASLNARARG